MSKLTVEQVIRDSRGPHGDIRLLSGKAIDKAWDRFLVHKFVSDYSGPSLGEIIQNLIDSGYLYIRVYLTTTSVRSYYNTLVLAR